MYQSSAPSEQAEMQLEALELLGGGARNLDSSQTWQNLYSVQVVQLHMYYKEGFSCMYVYTGPHSTGTMLGYCFIYIAFSIAFRVLCYLKKKRLQKVIYWLSVYMLHKLKFPSALYFAWSQVCKTEMRPEAVWEH